MTLITLAKRTLDRLPKAALATVQSLEEDLQNILTISRALSDELRANRDRRMVIEGEVRNLAQGDHAWSKYEEAVFSRAGLLQHGVKNGLTFASVATPLPQMKQYGEELAQLMDRKKVLSERADALEGRRTNLITLFDAVQDFIRALPAEQKLVEHASETPKVKGDLGEAIEKCRRRIRELKADLHTANSAPLPSFVQKAAARRQIEELAERGAPSFDLLEQGGSIVWPTLLIRTDTHRHPQEIPDQLAIFARYCGAQMLADIEKEIDRDADDSQALTDEQRRDKFATICSDLLATERDEEMLVREARARDLRVDRRSDADPRALLGLSSSLPAPKG